MTDPDKRDELNRWVEIMNETNGYGGVFNHQTAADKAIVELSTAREWRESIAVEFGVTVGEPEYNVDEPPDCHVSVDGQTLGVELRQLVESEHKQRAAKGETPYAGQLFMDMQWSKERLVSELKKTIQEKGDKYKRKGNLIDVLLIHTDEPWLSSSQAREWLSDIQIEPHPNIASAFLLFSYEPGRGVEHWPVLWLYGELGGVRQSRRK